MDTARRPLDVGGRRDTDVVAQRKLPNLTPDQVIAIQDSLLSNANRLFTSALLLLDGGETGLARSIAILGLEESGKAIALHNRRIAIVHAPEGEPFVDDELVKLWGSHDRKLRTVHMFLLEERYWFGVDFPDHEAIAEDLGPIDAWSRDHNLAKQGGLYVDVDDAGDPVEPAAFADEDALRKILARVHQIGHQLRLGEHIEGSQQDAEEEGRAPQEDDGDAFSWVQEERMDEKMRQIIADMKQSLREGTPGKPLANAGYRFNRPTDDLSNPFRHFGRPGHEAEDRELIALAAEIKKERGQ